MSHATSHASSPFRARRLAFAAFALGALAASSVLVACGDDDDDGDTTPTNTPTEETTPTTPAETPTTPAETPDDGDETPGGTATGTATTPDGDGDVQIPDNSEDYASALFDAWADGDMEALDALATDEALEVLESREYESSDGWTQSGCDGAAGSLNCTWEAADGEQLQIRVANEAASMGEPEAVREVRFV